MVIDLHRLAEVSRRLGSEIGYIQGGGGNTSIKCDSDEMYIKASGLRLDCISAETGFFSINWSAVKTGIAACYTELDYKELLASASLRNDANARPSIETGFHALLGRCVLHSHSVWANILTCSKEGKDLATELFPSALWVPYFTPGLHLTKAISAAMRHQPETMIFLQNHGLVVCGDNEYDAFNLHEETNSKIRDYFGTSLPFPVGNLSFPKELKQGLLFPDQAVYHSNPVLAESPAGRETMQACDFLLQNIPRLGLTISFIDEAEKNTLVSLESEIYRQKVSGA